MNMTQRFCDRRPIQAVCSRPVYCSTSLTIFCTTGLLVLENIDLVNEPVGTGMALGVTNITSAVLSTESEFFQCNTK
jgi:hypothetical protein